MAYYILPENFELCGWKGLPFGLRYPNPHYTDFFDKERYKVIYALDGKHDIKEEELTNRQKKLFRHLVDIKMAIPTDGTARLKPWQEYKTYPGMYKSSVQWSITGRCNYKCRHCFMSAPDYCGEDLTLEQSLHIMDELVKCGYVQEYKDQYTPGRPLCLRLVDPFLLFHYRFLSGSHPESMESFEDYRADSGRYNNWRGQSFEILCLSHVDQIKKALGISGVRTSAFSWVSKRKTGGAQIDLVIERDDGITNLCEAKFTDTPFSISAEYEQKLLHKVRIFKEESHTHAALKLVMICSEGIAGAAHTEHVSRTLTLDDLFE